MTILAQVQNKEWWKSTLKWIRPLHGPEVAKEDKNQPKTSDEPPVKQTFHPFYRSLCDGKPYPVEVKQIVVL